MFALLSRFGAWLLGGLVALAPTLVGKVLVALGVSVVTYTGLSLTIDFFKAQAIGAFTGLPVELVGVLSLMKVGVCLSMYFSAVSIRLALQGLAGDTVKRLTKT